MDNPEKMATQGTEEEDKQQKHNTTQRNWQHRVHNKCQRIPKGNQKWTTQRNWQHRVHNKRQRIPKGKSKMDNPKKLATQGTQ